MSYPLLPAWSHLPCRFCFRFIRIFFVFVRNNFDLQVEWCRQHLAAARCGRHRRCEDPLCSPAASKTSPPFTDAPAAAPNTQAGIALWVLEDGDNCTRKLKFSGSFASSSSAASASAAVRLGPLSATLVVDRNPASIVDQKPPTYAKRMSVAKERIRRRLPGGPTYAKRMSVAKERVRRRLPGGPFSITDDSLFRRAAHQIQQMTSAAVCASWETMSGEDQLRHVLPGGEIRKCLKLGLYKRTAAFLEEMDAYPGVEQYCLY
ncbi:hypothetical protein BS78_05G044500 [Paspalum vaginatum]|nr:hypothetical protein BS78_05G044500 [Paspalum vaginatum]